MVEGLEEGRVEEMERLCLAEGQEGGKDEGEERDIMEEEMVEVREDMEEEQGEEKDEAVEGVRDEERECLVEV